MDDKEFKISLSTISKEIWKGVSAIVFTGLLASVAFYYNTTNRIEQLREDVDRHTVLIDQKADKESIAEIKESINRLDAKVNHIIDLIINEKQK